MPKQKETLSPMTMERRKRVGLNIKRLRKDRGIATQEKLAELLNMDRSYIGRLESGNAPLGIDMEQRLAEFFNVNFDEFYRPIAVSEIDRELEALKDDLKRFGGLDKIKKARIILRELYGTERQESGEHSDSHGKEKEKATRKKSA